MKTSHFEGVKVALKQDRTGYVLTLSIHPDDLPEEILRDLWALATKLSWSESTVMSDP